MSPHTDAGALLKLADDCALYAKVIEGIIVVENDYQPGDVERREPRETLLKAEAFLRQAASQGSAGVSQVEVRTEQADNDLGIVLSALHLLEEAVGETFDDEGGIVAQIEADYKARQPALIKASRRTAQAVPDPIRAALIGINGAIDDYWNDATDSNIKLICYWQFKSREALAEPSADREGK